MTGSLHSSGQVIDWLRKEQQQGVREGSSVQGGAGGGGVGMRPVGKCNAQP